ncbi:hypothetical protein EDB85DRAFT_1896135 [Lactarius pseudohatsudake]|nr:hypothetical protein EDB85DRAFT_1896135 [Lactarius pseudohatsudake]
MEIDVGVVDSAECMVHEPAGDEGDLTCVPTKIRPWGWIAPKRPGTSKTVGTARTRVVSGQMYKKVLFPEQMSEVLQHVAKIPRDRIEAIECGIQGDLVIVGSSHAYLPKSGPRGWIAPKRPGTSKTVGTARIRVFSGQMYKKVLFPEQMSEVLQRVAKIPRERIESIERGVQGDVTFLSDKELVRWPADGDERGKVSLAGKRPCERIEAIKPGVQGDVRCCRQRDCPKATRDVEDGGNSEDLQRMDGFVRRCLRGIKSVVEIVGGQMYKKVLFAEQKSEVLQHAAESLRKRNDAIEKRLKKSELAHWGQGNGEAGAGTHEQMSEVLQHATHVEATKKVGRKTVRRGRARTSKCRKSCNMPRERIEAIEKVRAGQPGQENGQGRARTSNRSKCRKSCNM